MMVRVAIRDDFVDWPAFADRNPFVRKAVRTAIKESRVQTAASAEISVVFCDDGFIADLNSRWRHKAGPTNVLSFPAASGEALKSSPMLGDIIVSCDTVLREAADEGKAFNHHLAHMLVHGTLHLLGFVHENDEQAEQMEACERSALARLGIPDPYR